VACGDARFAIHVTHTEVTVEYMAGTTPWLVTVNFDDVMLQQTVVPGTSCVVAR